MNQKPDLLTKRHKFAGDGGNCLTCGCDWYSRNHICEEHDATNCTICFGVDAVIQQPRPTGTGADITSLVMADLQARSEFGQKKYGQKLHAFNGRDALMDAYQEALDLCVYLRQAMAEREAAIEQAITQDRKARDSDDQRRSNA